MLVAAIIAASVLTAIPSSVANDQLAAPYPLGWHIETVDSEDYVGYESSLALDSAGNPHISYYDNTNYALKYATLKDGNWSVEVVDSSCGPWTSSIALDAQDDPHISYTCHERLNYTKRINGNWTFETPDPGPSRAKWPSIAVDQEGDPHISYHAVPDGDLKYASRQNGSWTLEVIDSEGDVGEESSLALDEDGYPHISYLDSSNMDLKFAEWTGSNWSVETVESAGRVGMFSSIALDDAGNPHISYNDYAYEDYVKYAVRDGLEWTIEIVDSFGRGTSIALDSTGNPHISCFDSLMHDLKYAHRTEKGWVVESLDYWDNAETSIALDSNDNPHISYLDWVQGDLKYATFRNLLYGPVYGNATPGRGPGQDVILGSDVHPRIQNSNGQELKDIPQVRESVQVKLSGKWKDGTAFEAYDYIRVIYPGRK